MEIGRLLPLILCWAVGGTMAKKHGMVQTLLFILYSSLTMPSPSQCPLLSALHLKQDRNQPRGQPSEWLDIRNIFWILPQGKVGVGSPLQITPHRSSGKDCGERTPYIGQLTLHSLYDICPGHRSFWTASWLSHAGNCFKYFWIVSLGGRSNLCIPLSLWHRPCLCFVCLF